jgi:hypothetical protein
VFWSVLYLILGRILQFLILLGRGDRAKEVEILALRHQVAGGRVVPQPERWPGPANAMTATARRDRKRPERLERTAMQPCQ